MTSKFPGRSRFLAALVAAAGAVALPAAAQAAQVTLKNEAGRTLTLYIGDDYACTALKNLMCTSQANEGSLTLYAKDGETVYDWKTINLGSGESYTWTVE